MRIEDINVYETAPEGINLTVVKLVTSDPGLYGFGCATFAYRHESVRHVIEEYLLPLLRGRDASAVGQIWHLVHHNAYWRNGPIENNALAGIDMALWDIKGKMAGMPLYQLFGGKHREGVPVYRHADGRDADEICDNIQKFREQGISTIRCQCGGYGGTYGTAPSTAPEGSPDGVYLDSRSYMRDTLTLFGEIRARFGFDIGLCHDVHERLAPVDAVTFAKEMEPFRLFFLEDALPLEQIDWLRRLRRLTTTPLAYGELFNNPAEWRSLIAERLIDYIRVHVTQIGGITPARKLQIFAEQFGVRTAWHGPGDMSPFAHAANIHLDLAAHNFGIQEWSGTEPPNYVIQDLSGPKDALLDVFPGMPVFRKGYVYPNDTPGLGVGFNEKEASRYPCGKPVVRWTQTRGADGTLIAP